MITRPDSNIVEDHVAQFIQSPIIVIQSCLCYSRCEGRCQFCWFAAVCQVQLQKHKLGICQYDRYFTDLHELAVAMTGVIKTVPNKKEAVEADFHGGKEFCGTIALWPPVSWLSSADSSAVQAHDESNDCNIGDTVRIHMSRSFFALLKSVQWHQDMATDMLSSIRRLLGLLNMHLNFAVLSLLCTQPDLSEPFAEDALVARFWPSNGESNVWWPNCGKNNYCKSPAANCLSCNSHSSFFYHSWLLLWLYCVWHVAWNNTLWQRLLFCRPISKRKAFTVAEVIRRERVYNPEEAAAKAREIIADHERAKQQKLSQGFAASGLS